MHVFQSSVWTSLALAILCAAPARADHKDERLGFTIATPKEWTTIPMKVEERWLLADYQSPKSNFWTDKGGNWTIEHKPDMQMIAFVSEQVKAQAKVQKKVDKKTGKESYIVDFDSPYKDYKDYMQRRYTGGGWYIDKEEETKAGDVPVTAIEIRVDKLSNEGPKKIIAWIYHVPDVDIAVQFEVLADAYPKLQNDIQRCLKSFKPIARSGEALVRDVSTGKKYSLLDLDDMTPDERKNARIAMERDTHERASKNVPDGWTVKQMGRFLVINHTDEKFAKAVVDQAEGVWNWLEQSFPFVGEKEYVRSPVIRLCKNEAEYMQFWKVGSWTYNNLEIFAYQDFGGSGSYQMQAVNRRILEVWFEDRDHELLWAMPRWLRDGLQEVIAQAAVKAGKVDFKNDDWNRDEVRQVVREGKAKKPRELLMMCTEDSWKDYANVRQSQALVGFLVTGPAARSPKTKNFLQDYVKSLKTVQLALKGEEKKAGAEAGAKKPTTEEEEDAYFKDQAQGYKKKEQRILEETSKRAFGSWSDKDWSQFEEIYFKAIS